MIPINSLAHATFVPVFRRDLPSKVLYHGLFLLSVRLDEWQLFVLLSFVDIDGIVNLHFLFINLVLSLYIDMFMSVSIILYTF